MGLINQAPTNHFYIRSVGLINQAPTNKSSLCNSYMYLISTEKAACPLFFLLINQAPTIPLYLHKVGMINQAPTNKSYPYNSSTHSAFYKKVACPLFIFNLLTRRAYKERHGKTLLLPFLTLLEKWKNKYWIYPFYHTLL